MSHVEAAESTQLCYGNGNALVLLVSNEMCQRVLFLPRQGVTYFVVVDHSSFLFISNGDIRAEVTYLSQQHGGTPYETNS